MSALTISDDILYIASNPPQKVKLDHDPASAQYYGHSRLWRLPIGRAICINNWAPCMRLFSQSQFLYE
jgi:hypothetical protein